MIITCLMTTKNRRHLAPIALESYAAQLVDATFEKRLVVIEDGDDDISDLAGVGTLPDRHYMRYDGTLPEKIAAAIEKHPSDAYAVWDDDDYSHPWRLLLSAQCLLDGYSAVGFRYVVFYEMRDDKCYIHMHDEPMDATLAFTREYWERGAPPDPLVDDWVSPFRAQRGAVFTVEYGNMYVALRHGLNTSNLTYESPYFAPFNGQWELPEEVKAFRRKLYG